MKPTHVTTAQAAALPGGTIHIAAAAVALGFAIALAFLLPASAAEPAEVESRLAGLDEYMSGIVKHWNLPGIGVAIVHRDRTVLARGYGYRDYGRKLPFTPQTVMPIASNTKLFTVWAPRRRGQARLGRTDSRARALDPVLDRHAQRPGHAARHAFASRRPQPPRHDLVQILVHPIPTLRPSSISRTFRSLSPDLPLVSFHGGALPGFYSQLAVLPQDEFGVIVLVIGDHASTLPNFVTYSVIERLLGLSATPWSQRGLEARLKDKAAGTAARAKAGAGRVPGTTPSHPLDGYTGQFENPAYGVVKIESRGEGLHFTRDELSLPFTHFHYDRFDSPDDEREGLWSLNFRTSPAGEIDTIVISLDEAEASFTRRADPELSRPDLLRSYAGRYLLPDGRQWAVNYDQRAGGLVVHMPGQPPMHLVPWRPQRFRTREFSNYLSEFVVEAGRVTALKQIDPSGELVLPRK